MLFSIFKILQEWERAVILRFGKTMGIRGPGIIILIPFVERMIRIDTRTITMDVQPQDVITRDNVTLKVNAVIYFRVMDPEAAVIKVEDYYFATTQLAQTTLRSVLGQYSLDDLLQNRDKINQTLQSQLDKATEAWGIKISVVEVKHIDLPKEMQRAMAKEAEAERERRSKIIGAEGELQRSEKLSQAAEKLAENPGAISLAYLQAMTEIQKEGKTTIIFPIPLDLIKPFLETNK
ncbi:MAG: slipin family protein [Bdellovibrionales bacterium]|nr:slipin family protein [Bdellovibrionales bacterium]